MKERLAYEDCLKDLSAESQIAELRQFFIDMMDWNQQSGREDIYILLEKSLKFIAEELRMNNIK